MIKSMNKRKIELNKDESIVLVDFLIRFRENEKIDFIHEAEKQILYDLCALLEQEVPELLNLDYKKSLEVARDNVANLDYENQE